jgi:hypothetical protein
VEHIFREDYSLSYDLESEWDSNIYISFGKEIFYLDELNKLYKKNNFSELSKYSIKYLIEKYQREISNYYLDLSEKLESLLYGKLEGKESIMIEQDLQTHFRSYYNEWRLDSKWLNYNLDKDLRMTNSNKSDYMIYELVNIYRGTDWDNKSIISFEI